VLQIVCQRDTWITAGWSRGLRCSIEEIREVDAGRRSSKDRYRARGRGVDEGGARRRVPRGGAGL